MMLDATKTDLAMNDKLAKLSELSNFASEMNLYDVSLTIRFFVTTARRQPSICDRRWFERMIARYMNSSIPDVVDVWQMALEAIA
jgi:hypothetical protein